MDWEPIICTGIVCLTAMFITERFWQEVFGLRVFINQWLQMVLLDKPQSRKPNEWAATPGEPRT